MRLNQAAFRSAAFDRVTDRTPPPLAHPTANAFDPAPWFAVLEDEAATDRDRTLATGALYFGRQFRSLRQDLLRPAVANLGGYTLLRLALAQANRALLIARGRIAKAQVAAKLGADGIYDMQALARIGGSRLQPNMSADEIITTIVDALPHWLFHAAERMNDHDVGPLVLRDAGARVEGILSVERGLRNLWLSILWEDQRLTWEGQQARLVLGDPDTDTLWAAWEFRQQDLSFQELLADSAAVRRGELPRIPPATIVRSAVGLQRGGRTVRIKLGPATGGSRRRQNRKLRVLEESYLAIFLDEPIPSGDQQVTPRLLMKAMCVVGDVAELLLAECRHSEVNTAADLRDLSLPISRNALSVALRGALEISEDVADAVLNRLTTDTADVASAFKEGVWHRPLISHEGGDALYVLAAAALSGMPTRQVERWLVAGGKADGLSKGSRGIAYEAEVRRILTSAATDNDLLNDISVAPTAVKRGKAGEEIDLLVRVGRTIMVGEIKCLLVPSEALERYHHLGKLEAAADQASRKAEWLRANREIFRTHLAGLPDDLDGLVIRPLVVLNNGIGLGAAYGDAVITDVTTLTVYLSGGQYSHSALIGPRGEFIPQLQTLYRSAAEGEARLFDTLADPPSLMKWIRAVRWRVDKFPVGEGELEMLAYELDPAAMRTSDVVRDAALLNAGPRRR